VHSTNLGSPLESLCSPVLESKSEDDESASSFGTAPLSLKRKYPYTAGRRFYKTS